MLDQGNHNISLLLRSAYQLVLMAIENASTMEDQQTVREFESEMSSLLEASDPDASTTTDISREPTNNESTSMHNDGEDRGGNEEPDVNHAEAMLSRGMGNLAVQADPPQDPGPDAIAHEATTNERGNLAVQPDPPAGAITQEQLRQVLGERPPEAMNNGMGNLGIQRNPPQDPGVDTIAQEQLQQQVPQKTTSNEVAQFEDATERSRPRFATRVQPTGHPTHSFGAVANAPPEPQSAVYSSTSVGIPTKIALQQANSESTRNGQEITNISPPQGNGYFGPHKIYYKSKKGNIFDTIRDPPPFNCLACQERHWSNVCPMLRDVNVDIPPGLNTTWDDDETDADSVRRGDDDETEISADTERVDHNASVLPYQRTSGYTEDLLFYVALSSGIRLSTLMPPPFTCRSCSNYQYHWSIHCPQA